MKDCDQDARIASALPDFARNQHGNLAEQNRLIGPLRGTNTAATQTTPASAVVPAHNGNDQSALAIKHNCSACHAPASKLVGPSQAEISAKYKGDAGAEANLMAKVRAGGSGVWGAIQMPPHPGLSEDDLRALVRWYLAHGL
jgi:S-disulfanyl-L-cysteine oxidoreductase SoxD